MRITQETCAGVTPKSPEGKREARTYNDIGTVTIEHNEVVTIRLKTYSGSPAEFNEFFRKQWGAGTNGQDHDRQFGFLGQIEKIRHQHPATTGITTYMARMDFNIRSGRHHR